MRGPIGHDMWSVCAIGAGVILGLTLVFSFGDLFPW